MGEELGWWSSSLIQYMIWLVQYMQHRVNREYEGLMTIETITIFKSLVSYTAAAQWLSFTIAIVDVYVFIIYSSMESYVAM